MAKRTFAPVHPGVTLAKDFLKGLKISQYQLARGIAVSPRRINEIVHGKRGVSADTALRLGKFFGMEAQFWMNLQSQYDLEVAKDALAGKLDHEVTTRRQEIQFERELGSRITARFAGLGLAVNPPKLHSGQGRNSEVRRMRDFLARQKMTTPVMRKMRRRVRD